MGPERNRARRQRTADLGKSDLGTVPPDGCAAFCRGGKALHCGAACRPGGGDCSFCVLYQQLPAVGAAVCPLHRQAGGQQAGRAVGNRPGGPARRAFLPDLRHALSGPPPQALSALREEGTAVPQDLAVLFALSRAAASAPGVADSPDRNRHSGPLSFQRLLL